MRWELAPYSAPWQAGQQMNTRSRFRTDWQGTLHLLGAETGFLDSGLVVIEVDATAEGLTRDRHGFRPGATPATSGVRVTFDSKHGQQRYATGAFYNWRHNVHAIACSLESLRRVDRFGVSRGEQYVGFRPALEAASKPAFDTPRAAVRWMMDQAEAARVELGSPDQVYKRLMRRWHPDTGKLPEQDAGLWARLQEAHQVLERAGVL